MCCCWHLSHKINDCSLNLRNLMDMYNQPREPSLQQQQQSIVIAWLAMEGESLSLRCTAYSGKWVLLLSTSHRTRISALRFRPGCIQGSRNMWHWIQYLYWSWRPDSHSVGLIAVPHTLWLYRICGCMWLLHDWFIDLLIATTYTEASLENKCHIATASVYKHLWMKNYTTSMC